MRILFVNKFLYPHGGSETYIFELGKQLVRMGHNVEFFGMQHPDRIVGNHAGCYTSNLDFHTGRLSRMLYPFKIIYSREAGKKIGKVLLDFKPDVVHLNNFNFQLTPSIIYAVKNYEKKSGERVRLIFTAHDYQLVCPNHMMKNPTLNENCERCLGGRVGSCAKYRCIHNSFIKSLLGSSEAWIYKQLKTYRYLDVLVCPSHFIEEKFKRNPLFQDKTVTMHNFVELRECTEITKRRYVLYFGRFSDEKGVRTLLDACKKLPKIHFIFAGSGILEKEIDSVENIENRGFLKGEELKRVIAEAAFSICPSEWYENCPFSVMESIVCGTPVIGADIGGIPELIEPGKTGELFKPGDVEELCEKIMTFWENGEVVQRFSVNCRNKHFDTVSEYCAKLLNLYSE